MCVPLPHEQDTNSVDTAYEIVCLRILDLRTDVDNPIREDSSDVDLDDESSLYHLMDILHLNGSVR